MAVAAGNGGDGGEYYARNVGYTQGGFGGNGGDGGDATVNGADKSVVVHGALSVSSGINGRDGTTRNEGSSSFVGSPGTGGKGGAATFTADTLTAPTINLTKNDGALTFTVTTLDMSVGSTTLNLTGTSAANVNVTTANLSGGNLFSLNNSAGDMTLATLNVTGSGRLYVADGGKQSITALNAQNANLTFVLPSTLQANDKVVSVTDADLTGTTLGVAYQSVRPGLAVNEQLVLLDATSSLNTDITTLTVQTANGDVYTLNVQGNQLLAVLDYIAPTTPAYERLKAYAEGRAATLAFVNQGQELIINQGFGSALAATSGPGFRMNAFGGMGGGKSRYDSGSHVDVEGFSMLAGIAVGNDVGIGRLTLGAFSEGGWGSYDSHNSFSNFASVNGDGDTSYYGGGLLGRYDLTSGALSGLYFDASARLGRAKMDFDTDDIKYNGSDADFDSASLYYGLHGGIGYIWNITDAASLDLSAKLLWTRQESDSVSVHGDRVRFKDADSLRTRLGGRFAYAVSEHFTPYVGAYWEHEYDSKARSTVNGNSIDAPDLKGDTGMGELGISFKPVADSGLSLDLAVQGYTGKREGVTGSFQLKFEF